MINLLPKNLVNKIAAGEVVERPASVVKELIENAIDAHATSIEVKIQSGGLERIRIEDNGSGIAKDDLDKLFISHATSKIVSFEDLEHVTTFGFRGEALASIASVADITLITKTNHDSVGTRVTMQQGKKEKTANVAKNGTIIEVSNLFHNLPARRKFMRSEKVELSYCMRVIEEVALANHAIQFKIYTGTSLTKIYPATTEDERIKQIVKRNVTPYGYLFDSTDMHIAGSVTKPGTIDKSADQYLFVNNRPVTSPLIAKAIKEAYRSYLKTDSKPSYVLFISMNPEHVDVNVHPRKIEVRFFDQRNVYTKVYQSLIHAFERESQVVMPEVNIPTHTPPLLAPSLRSRQSRVATERKRKEMGYDSSINISDVLSFSAALLQDTMQLPHKKYLQVGKKFIVYEDQTDLVVVDQHGASERVNYEKLQKVFTEKVIGYVTPLLPIVIPLSASSMSYALAHYADIQYFGIDIEETKGGIAIKRFADFMPQEKIDEIFADLLSFLQDGGSEKLEIKEKIIASLACRSAIMFNQALSQEEMSALIDALALCAVPATCAHGRPVMYKIPFAEILKKLARC